MNQFIQSLESRTLFSVNLTGDQAAIAADAVAVKADTVTLAAQNKSDLAAITADLKALPKTTTKTNTPLLKLIKTDVTKLTSSTNADQNALTKTSSADANKAVIAGNKLQNSFTTANENAVTKDTNILGLIVAPLGPIDLDLGKLQTTLNGPLITDLGTVGTANPTATQLQSDIAALNSAYAAASAQLTADANQYQTDLATLASDMSIVQSSGPNILFDYSGVIKETAGSKVGKSLNFDFNITQQTAGFWQATYTAVNGAGVSVSQPASGTISGTGVFSGDLSNGTLFTGIVSGNTIKGTAQSSALAGTFVATH